MSDKPKRKQLRWRREPRATGLASVCQGTRGWELRYGGEQVATVAVFRARMGDRWADGPWYFCASSESISVPWRNTASENVAYATADEAKKLCAAYVRKCMGEAKP